MDDTKLRLRHSVFDPAAVKVMAEVFETSWDTLRPTLQDRTRAEIDDMRMALAKAILHFASAGTHDVERLRGSAFQALRQAYPELERERQPS